MPSRLTADIFFQLTLFGRWTIAHMPSSNALFNCLLVFNVPFTLCKGALDVVLCFLIYKPLSPLLHK